MKEEDLQIILDAINKKKFESDDTSMSNQALELRRIMDMDEFKEKHGLKVEIIPTKQKGLSY